MHWPPWPVTSEGSTDPSECPGSAVTPPSPHHPTALPLAGLPVTLNSTTVQPVPPARNWAPPGSSWKGNAGTAVPFRLGLRKQEETPVSPAAFRGPICGRGQDETSSSSVHLVLAKLGAREGLSSGSRGAGIGCRYRVPGAILEYKCASQHTPQFHASLPVVLFPLLRTAVTPSLQPTNTIPPRISFSGDAASSRELSQRPPRCRPRVEVRITPFVYVSVWVSPHQTGSPARAPGACAQTQPTPGRF